MSCHVDQCPLVYMESKTRVWELFSIDRIERSFNSSVLDRKWDRLIKLNIKKSTSHACHGRKSLRKFFLIWIRRELYRTQCDEISSIDKWLEEKSCITLLWKKWKYHTISKWSSRHWRHLDQRTKKTLWLTRSNHDRTFLYNRARVSHRCSLMSVFYHVEYKKSWLWTIIKKILP